MNMNVLMLGGICIDKYNIIDNFPKLGGDTMIHSEFSKIGGCPINVSHTLKNLGLNPILYSTIGDDAYSDKIINHLNDFDLDKSCIIKMNDKANGYCLIFLDKNGERTFLAYKGCEGHFDSNLIPQEIMNVTDIIYLTGIYLTYKENNKSLITFLESAVASGKKLIFDPGPLLNDVDPNILKEVLSLSYIITPSSDELTNTKKILNIKSNKEFLCHFKALRYIIETSGSKGSRLITRNSDILYPSYPAEVKDTNGAGDSFVGGLIYGLSKDLSIDEIMAAATACGSLATEFIGTEYKFSLQDIEAKIKSSEIENSVYL